MDLHLKGKNAVILGGTRGIGRAIAETLVGEGANVAICARNADQVKDAVGELKSKGTKVTGGAVDIMDGAALKSWIAKAAGELGGIDILISNAGAMAQGADPASWESNFKLDVLGAVNAFDAAYPFLEKAADKNKDAAFVIIASVSAAEADSAASYGPIKAALIHYAKGLARQHAKRGIRANVVSPGMVYSKAACGTWSRRTCPTISRRRWRAIRQAAPRHRKTSPMQRCSWRVPHRPTRRASIFWSTAQSAAA